MSMPSRLPMPGHARHDPWWDVEGRSVRRRRRLRQSLAVAVLVGTVVLVGSATRSPEVQRGAATIVDLAAAQLAGPRASPTR